MPDITMCLTKTCPNKDRCYRFTVEPDILQSYSDFTELCNNDSDENYLWPIEPERIADESNIS